MLSKYLALEKNPEKTILFLPNRFSYHESGINQIINRPNSSFRAYNYVPKSIYFDISKCVPKVRQNMAYINNWWLSPFMFCIYVLLFGPHMYLRTSCAIYLIAFCGTKLNSEFITHSLLEDNKLSFLHTTVLPIVRLTIWHHPFLEFWLINAWFFAHWRHQRAITRLNIMRQLNISWGEKLGFQLPYS